MQGPLVIINHPVVMGLELVCKALTKALAVFNLNKNT